jgi:Flp pilus assembly protein TadD
LKAFVGVVAVSGLVACEEADPPAKQPPVVAKAQVAPPVPMPAPMQPPTPSESTPAKAPPHSGEVTAAAKAVAKIESDEVDVDDDKPTVLVEQARQALATGDLERAHKLAGQAVKKLPNRWSAWNVLGRVQLARGERKEAIASFEQAVELNPKSSWAQNNLGLAYLYEGRYDDAVDALEEATSLEPAEAYMFNNLGMAYEHLDRLEEAREAYHEAVDRKNDRAKENLARLEGVKSVFRSAKLDKTVEDVSVGGDTH